MKNAIKSAVVFITVGFLFTGCPSKNPEPIQFSEKPYFFDVGEKGTEIHDGYYPLTPDFTYSAENGYGWTEPFEDGQTFNHDYWEASRNAALIDGIASSEVQFKADIPNGDWWLTLWVDGGLEDSSTTELFILEENEELNLQAFMENAEQSGLRPDPQKMYRIIQKPVTITDNELTFHLRGNRDDVRIMSFSLIPDQSTPQNDSQQQVYDQLAESAGFNGEDSVSAFRNILNQLPDEPENENFRTFWNQQIEILAQANKYFYYRGWSWAIKETGLGLFDHLHQSVMLYDGILNNSRAEESPLYEKALWHRGRLLYWLWLERGGKSEIAQGRKDLAKMQELHPHNELVRMYNGEKIDSPDEFDTDKPAGAPDWAFAQWEVMNRLKNIADWWILEQQDENGEFGGKYGDDVELLRFWPPLILSGDSIVYGGWKKLADGVWNSNKVHKGYAKSPSDVEHSSEFISDTAPLMVLYTDDAVYEERLAWSADYFRNLWTGFNDNGNRFFKSSWFSSTELEMEPPKNRDVPYTTRATKAVRYYAWKTKDAETLQALEEWADAWLHVSQLTDKGKPVGIIPASVEFPSESFNGDEEHWYTANMFWDYFEWSGGSSILDQFLFTWTITGNDKYLEPIIQHLDLVSEYRNELAASVDSFEEGSTAWAAHTLGNSSSFWNLVETWRLLTGNENYDELIIEHGTPFIKYRLTGNEEFLVEGMQPYLETIRYNYPMVTSEAIHTDRVHIGPGNQREAGILQGMVTGYGIGEGASPYIAVSWEDASRDISFLVTDSDSTTLNVDLYSFSDTEEQVTVRFWQLKSGEYTLEVASGKEIINNKKIAIQKRGDRSEFILPSKKLIKLTITPNEN
ncbi:MAG: hypothetical protein WD059_02815 [Balneolaceae bacterium]